MKPKNSARFLVAAALLAVISAGAFAWDTRVDEDGILVQSRLNAGARYQEFRAQTEIDATIAQAIALLKDTSACTAWLFRCRESRVIQEISATERTFYQVTALPFPVKSRDSIFHAAITFEDQNSVKITMRSMPDDIPLTKHVRVRDAFGTYFLEPIGEGRLRITWQQYIDPAGALPAWLVNSMLNDLPFKSLQAFRDLVRKRPYSDAQLVYDQDGSPVGIDFTGSPD